MRIISRFHDFYDVGQRSMMDREVLYMRETQELCGEDKVPECCRVTHDIDMPRNHSGRWAEAALEIIGFCGQLIPLVKVRYPDPEQSGWAVTKIVYKMEDLPEAAQVIADRLQHWFDSLRFLEMFGTAQETPALELQKLFLHYRVPIFYIEHTYYPKLILNPSLNDLEFYRFMDPITTFQNVFRFVANDLAINEDPEVNIPDDIMAASKGHGGKYSFRTAPGTKKRKGKPKGRIK